MRKFINEMSPRAFYVLDALVDAAVILAILGVAVAVVILAGGKA